MIHFLIEEWPVMKSESFITIISYRFHDLIIVKDFNSFQSQKWQQQNIMLTICWSAITIIHDSYLVINQRITTKVYCQQMEEMYIYLSKIRRGPILFSACCQDDTAEGHLIWIRNFDTSTICHWSLTHSNTSFSSILTSFTPKDIPLQWWWRKCIPRFLVFQTVRI